MGSNTRKGSLDQLETTNAIRANHVPENLIFQQGAGKIRKFMQDVYRFRMSKVFAGLILLNKLDPQTAAKVS
jgi:hypothetical protein